MNKIIRKGCIVLTAAAMVFVAACADRGKSAAPEQDTRQGQGTTAQGVPGAFSGDGRSQVLSTGQGAVPIREHNGEAYVQADQVIDLLGFNKNWEQEQRTLKFGDNDANYEVKADSTEVRKGEDKLNIKSAPVLLDGALFLPVSALGDLLSEDTTFTVQDGKVVFSPAQDQVNLAVDEDAPLPQGTNLDFGEDQEDPNKTAAEPSAAAPEFNGQDEDGAVAAAALRNINIPSLIARAKQYLGVRYSFGTGSYNQTGRFDCSSYTQYLFGLYGVHLPRTARAQATLGNRVSRNSLRVGDLLFFYVPGRFKSNNTVGHVGIYIGNNNMINSSPKPKDGVQIININKAYWKRTYLYAKRVAS